MHEGEEDFIGCVLKGKVRLLSLKYITKRTGMLDRLLMRFQLISIRSSVLMFSKKGCAKEEKGRVAVGLFHS